MFRIKYSREVILKILFQCLFSLPPGDSLADLQGKLGELGYWIPPFLEIEISTTVDRFNDDLFSSPSGKEDKRPGITLRSERFQEDYPIFSRHLVI